MSWIVVTRTLRSATCEPKVSHTSTWQIRGTYLQVYRPLLVCGGVHGVQSKGEVPRRMLEGKGMLSSEWN